MSTGDEIILSLMEHHSNLIPWYFLRDKYGVVIKFANITESGEIDVCLLYTSDAADDW